jgi:L-alanine-DL-glutamate epimerase-like enolase superfamily enzyme
MKITDIEVIRFRSVCRERSTRWGYAEPLWGQEEPSTLDGNVIVPQTPGLGLEYDWDYINDNLIDE